MDMKAVAAMHIGSIKAAAEELSKLKGWSLKSAAGALRCAPMVIKEVEKIGFARKLEGAQKRELAVELILQIVPLPWWLSEGWARPLLDAFVNVVVDALKDRF